MIRDEYNEEICLKSFVISKQLNTQRNIILFTTIV